jgi:hypothetical protein
VPLALADDVVVLGEVQDLEATESVAQQPLGVHVLRVRRTARPVFQLARRVALQHEVSTRGERASEAREHLRALARRRELDEDRDDELVVPRAPVPRVDVGQAMVHRDAALGGQPPGLRDPGRREVEGRDVKPLLGEPHAVAALAIGDAQRAHAGPQEMRLARQERVRRGAVVVVLDAEALVPVVELAGVWHANARSVKSET